MRQLSTCIFATPLGQAWIRLSRLPDFMAIAHTQQKLDPSFMIWKPIASRIFVFSHIVFTFEQFQVTICFSKWKLRMPQTGSFTYYSHYPYSPKELYAYHARPGALERLLPIWEQIDLIEKNGTIEGGDTVQLKLRFGPISIPWESQHNEPIPGKEFSDFQLKGPFSHFHHHHQFRPEQDGTELVDTVSYQLPLHHIIPSQAKKLIDNKLDKNFRYREEILRQDLELHRKYSKKPLRILITGASGVLGSRLLPLLTTGGHQVWTLVRRTPDPVKNEIFWDPERNILDVNELPSVDGVIHLAGEYIGLSRWSEEKKKRVLNSRVQGTRLLVSTLAAMNQKPAVLLSSSAVGYYGNCPDGIVDENHGPGDDFISTVCSEWERATAEGPKAGIRTVLMRLGVGLTPQGGGLQRILSTAPIGFFRSFGHGNQMMSWMSIDDMVAAMLHCLATQQLHGPVNIAAPHPVSIKDFLRELSEITRKPLLLPIPELFLKACYGQMASEIVLSGCAVSTQKLEQSGFIFRHAQLRDCLHFLLGVP